MAAPSPRTALNLLQQFSIPLLAGVGVALVWANVSQDSYERVIDGAFAAHVTLRFLTNDLFMALFFGMAAVEITAAVAPGGSLHPLRKAINPLLATGGGVIGPILCFLAFNALWGSGAFARGWGIPTATDIAIAWLFARLVFGAGHPCVSFLLLLAVADDGISLAIIAIFYPSPERPVAAGWLLLVVAGMLAAYLLRRARVRSYWPTILLGGALCWIGLHNANLHPALALVFVVPFLEHQPWSATATAFDLATAPDRRSALQRFEHDWKLIVDLGLFLFGLCNAGVTVGAVSALTGIVFASLLLGKTLGIFTTAVLADACGFPLPAGVRRIDLLAVALIGGIGLTVALFVAGEAFPDRQLQDAAKMGALASALIGPLALVVARVLGIGPRQG